MLINKEKTYQIDNYIYKNFINLTSEELKFVWEWRNHEDTRKWMITKDIISFENHCAFVKNLLERDDAYYWLFYSNGIPMGVLSIIKVNYERKEGEPGYYLSPYQANSGIGIEMQYCYKKFFFDELGFENLFGHLLWGNTNAYQLSRFYGAIEDKVVVIDDRKYVKMHTPVSEFRKLRNEKLINQFVKFNKQNPVKW